MSEHTEDRQPTINTLLGLLDRYQVEVPQVQRDYAQGRRDSNAHFVRKNLLRDIRAAILRKTPPLDLNFVYGKVEDGSRFIPIDGQQRLTTLFLLHVYAFHNDDEKTRLLAKFSYETRKTSRDFLKTLVENRSVAFASTASPSEEIEDAEWFVSTWQHDPTIQSALEMLDGIAATFDDSQQLAEGLLDHENPPITFKFLDIENLGMADNLYIKLNARGRPLTPFEHFKARLVGTLKGYNSELGDHFCDDFEQLLDGRWTDLFWEEHRQDFDRTFLAYFGVLFRNNHLIDTDIDWSNSFDFEKLNLEQFRTIFTALNFLCSHPEEGEARRLIFDALTDGPSYGKRVLFHAVTTYLLRSEGKDRSSFTSWIRVMKNLIMNSRIDEQRIFNRAIDGVNSLADHWDSILCRLTAEDEIVGFDSEQVREERLKARLILNDEPFAAAIHVAEEHPYFSGQIRSGLKLAKSDDGAIDVARFNYYWRIIAELFQARGPKGGDLLRRALLSFGDYTLDVGHYKTLCVNDPNEGERTPSLKQLFSDHSKEVRPLLDELANDNDVSDKLRSIVDETDLPAGDWRRCFVDYPELFGWMSAAHLRLREVGDGILIIRKKSSNGYNFQLFLAALKVELASREFPTNYRQDLGMWSEHFLDLDDEGKTHVIFESEHFSVWRVSGDRGSELLFQSSEEDPIRETADYVIDELAREAMDDAN